MVDFAVDVSKLVGFKLDVQDIGASGVRRYERTIPSTGPINLPGAHDSRDGDRSDPTR